MGQAKQQMMDNEANNGLVDFLEQLLEREELEGALSGIAKQVVAQGASSMSDKQQNVVDNFIESYKSKNVCDTCDNDNVSTLTDYIEIVDEGTCPTCQYQKEKFMRE